MDRATKACPMKLPSFSGLISEDFLAFKAKFKRASIDNRITRKDQIEKLKECLQGFRFKFGDGGGTIPPPWGGGPHIGLKLNTRRS